MKKSLRRTLLISSTIAAVALLAAYHFLFSGEKTEYLTAAATRIDLEETVLASGTLQALKQVDVGAQVSGQLKSLKVALGDSVKKGQLLGEIDPVLQQNALRDAEAGLENVQSQKKAKQALLKQYELAYQRQKTLFEQDAGARVDLENAEAQLDTTRADLAALEAQIQRSRIQVDTAKANLAYTRIVAPIDGEVISIVTQEGQTVVSAQQAPTILKLANLDTITVKAQISEADVIRVKPGKTVYFTILGDPDQRHYSTLRAIEPAPDSINSTTTTTSTASSTTAVYYNGLFDVANPNHLLRVSMTAQVLIVLAEAKGALVIPLAALGEQDKKDGTYAVRVLAQENSGKDGKEAKPETRRVRLGIRNNVNAQVIEGLNEGEQVIVGDSISAAKDAAEDGNSKRPPPRH